METHIITITYRECAAVYGLSETDLREFTEFGLVQRAEAPDTILAEPDHLARLARLQHDLGLSPEGVDIVLAMRQRLLSLQAELQRQQARAAQLERLLGGSAPTFDID
ncbi:hypothetical protein PK28_01320 [Hymenobacter sp. DG25B]|uniref:chaperone modulator CbpM n=1 Tax=Hymenobacter sp. DG25B TaxID=1385664 RepID=UPI000540C8CE|nr:chaperone modulator CbpM [Hymenobacter sp. DG25B]AIZ62657.1 hypothetical protein PK28_01320 [Hymenobacter sp. DG25B]